MNKCSERARMRRHLRRQSANEGRRNRDKPEVKRESGNDLKTTP